jgi:hypothetical protein
MVDLWAAMTADKKAECSAENSVDPLAAMRAATLVALMEYLSVGKRAAHSAVS